MHITAPTYVTYGADTRTVTKVETADFTCGNAEFGDPAYGTVKTCTCQDGAPTPMTTCEGAAIPIQPGPEAACVRAAGASAAAAAAQIVEPVQTLAQIGSPVHDFGNYAAQTEIYYWNPDSYYSVRVNHDVCLQIDSEVGQPYLADNGFGSTVGGLESCRGRYGADYYYYRIDRGQLQAQATALQLDGDQALELIIDGLAPIHKNNQSCLLALNGSFYYWPNGVCQIDQTGTPAATAVSEGYLMPTSIDTYGGTIPDLHGLGSYQDYLNWNTFYVYRVKGISQPICDEIRRRNGQPTMDQYPDIDFSKSETCGGSYGYNYYVKNVQSALSSKTFELFNSASLGSYTLDAYYNIALAYIGLNQYGGNDYCAALHRMDPGLTWNPSDGVPGCGYVNKYNQVVFYTNPSSGPTNSDGSIIPVDRSMSASAVAGTPITAASGDTATQVPASLSGGSYVTSQNGKYALAFQTDGDIVLFRTADNALLWSAKVGGNQGTSLAVQGDGNVVAYRADGSAYWSTGTNGQGAVSLRLQNDGNVVLFTAAGNAVWATNTVFGT